MLKLVKRIHRGQRGFILAAFLIGLGIISVALIPLWFQYFGNTPDDAGYILPDRVIGYEWYAFGCTSVSGSQLDDVDWGIVIEPDETFQLVETAWRIGRQTSGDRVYYLDVHEYTGSAKGTFITRSVGIAVNDILEDTYPGAQPWRTFVFDEEPYLYAGTKYIIDLHYSGSTGRCFISTHSPADCVTGWVIGYWYEDPNGFSVTQGYPASIQGYKTRSPEVYTIGHEVNLDGSITLHGAVDVVGDMTCGFLVSDDYDLVDGGGGVAYEVEETSGWDSGRYLFDYRLAFLNTNVQYSYRAYASAYSQTWYGEVANFTRTGADVPIFVDTTITSNTANSVWFSTQTSGINGTGAVSYNVTISYGQNTTACLADEGEIVVASNVTADSVWQTQSIGNSDFSLGEQYWYRAVLAGNDSSLGYSDMKTFTRFDPDQPAALQWILNWLNSIGVSTTLANLWWLLGILGVIAIFAVAIGTRQKWIAILGSMILFVMLVYYEVVPVWVVILAVLIGGWIMFKLVFTRAHEETGD